MSTVPLALMALILRLLDSRYSPSRQRLVSWLCSMPHNLSSLPGEGSLALCCALCLHLLGPSSCSPAVSAASACHYAHFLAAQLSALQSVDGVAALLASARARLSGARTEASAAATRLRVREAVLYEEGEGGEEEGAGEQGAMLPPSPPVALFGRVAQLQANCCLAQLLRYSALSLETQGFEGLRACTAAALEEAPSLRALAASMALHAHQPLALRQALAAAAAAAAAPAPAVDGALAAPQQPPPPSALRATLQAALAPPTSYSLALSSLTRYYDFGYGTSIGGGSGASGSAGTPLGILLAGVGGPALTPSPRARELLISASSSAPVGGASFSTPAAGGAMGVGESGRQLAHHSVYALARLARAFGRLEEAGEALRECLKAAQGAGDACAASYTLQTLCELGNAAQLGLLREGEGEGSGSGSGSEQGSPHFTQEALTLLRRIRVRASELGLWRQQAHTSLALARDTFLYSCAAPAAAAAAAAGAGGWSGSASGASASASALPPSCLPVPHWFSLDTFTSMRQGGLVCGGFFPGGGEFAAGRLVVTTASGGAGGAGASGASGANPTTPAAAAAAAAAITSTPTTAFSPYLTPTPTASRTLQESLGSTATCALTSPTAAAAAASARLVRAIYQSTGGTPPPPPTGGSASALAAAAAAAATAAGVAATVAAGSSRGASGAPAPLRWEEVLQLQGEGHAARGDMWLGVSGVSAGGAAVGARLLAAAAARCGDVARGAAGGCGGRDWEQGAGEALAGYLAGLFKGSSSSSRIAIPLVL